MTSASHTPAHESTTTVASFRTWRGSRCIVARGPAGATITTCDQQGGVHYPKPASESRSYEQFIASDVEPLLQCFGDYFRTGQT